MPITVRIRRHLESETLYLPELRSLIGRDVEIVVRDAEQGEHANERYPLRGRVMRMEDPFEPVSEDDWEVLA